MPSAKILLVVATTLVLTSCATPRRWAVQSDDGEFVAYAGSATLSGTYFSDPSSEELQNLVCFFPDEPSQQRLPQDSAARASHWMCFSNGAAAKTLLGLNAIPNVDSVCYQGPAEITLREYRRYVAESEGVSLAELLRVHRSGAAAAVDCPVVQPSAAP